jgi:uncharacterized membrane protein HdeD (DUF308 family)
MNETRHPVSDMARHLWMSAVLIGVLTVILGVVILAWPGKSIIVAAVLFGVYLVVSRRGDGSPRVGPARLGGQQILELH